MKVIFQKSDLDTCLTALILGVRPSDDIVHAPKGAPEADLNDPNVFCIEAGGSGKAVLNNFDHHDPDHYFQPACRQALKTPYSLDDRLVRLVEYVCLIDEAKPIDPPVMFPSLSNIFSGMLLVEPDPILQFCAGMQIIKTLWDDGLDPFATLPERPEWGAYIDTKLANQEAIQGDLKNVQIRSSDSGLKVGFLESRHIGGIGSLYKQKCRVVILFNPAFGNPPVRKFTIAGNNTPVGHLKAYFDPIEPGWGGRDTILASPWAGSKLSIETVMQVVLRHL